ncbi:MAG: hypothetical protein FJY83_01440 [Candidatus Aminicenantes bacterium]|nr:hypothetical protein [Candidatus Aminicenantes bacterium]
MRKSAKRPGMLAVRRVLSLVEEALPPEVRPPGLNPEALAGGRYDLVRRLPSWVKRFGLLSGPAGFCLWCEPRREPAETFPSQMILNLPRGRYLVDVLDTESAAWVSTETAEGGPLVAGLPFTGSPVVAWIRGKG